MAKVKKIPTAEVSNNKVFDINHLDNESIRDAKILFLSAALINLGKRESKYFTSIKNPPEELVYYRNKITELSNTFSSYINKETFDSISKVSKIEITPKDSGKIHTDLLAFYMMFQVFNERVTINKALDKRLLPCLDVDYLKPCELIIDGSLLDNEDYEEEMWKLSVELVETIINKHNKRN